MLPLEDVKLYLRVDGDEMQVKIGDLRQRITFQKLTTTINESGFEVDTWEDYQTVWAAVSNIHGREYYAAAAVLQHYSGNSPTYITFFTYLDKPQQHADDEELITGLYVQVDVWSKGDRSFMPMTSCGSLYQLLAKLMWK